MRREDIPPPITYGSVCSGIEAATVAWRPLGWRAAWFSEIEPYPCALLAHHYPDVPNLGDMKQLARMIRDGYALAPDILCGGTPCQAFSIAGLRNSLEDARGNLSLVFCEIADEIDKRRAADGLLPAAIVWENVPGVLSTSDNAFGCFLAGLAGEDDPIEPPGGKWQNAGCVYGPKRTVAWRTLDAQYFGVAQRRRRVFVIASAREGFDPAEVLFEFDGVRRDTPPSREAGQEAAAATLRSTDGGSDVDRAAGGHLQPIQCFGGNNQSGPIDVATARNACGSGSGRLDFETETFLVQAVAAPVQRSVERPRGDGLDTLIAGTLQANGKAAGSATQQDAEAGLLIPVTYRDAMGLEHWPDDPVRPIAFSMKDHGGDASIDLAPTLRAGNHAGSHANGGNPPAIAFDARQTPVSSTDVFGALGSSSPQAQAVAFVQNSRDEVRLMNGDGQIVGALAAETGAKQQCYIAQCVTGDIAHTLKAEGFDASEDGTGRGQPIVAVQLQGGNDGELVHRARESARNLPAGALRGVHGNGSGGAPQERGLARPRTAESAAPMPELPYEGASGGHQVHVVRQTAQGPGVLRNPLSTLQEMGRSDDREGQPVRPAPEGLGEQPNHPMQDGGLFVPDAREGVLLEARNAGSTWAAGENELNQGRGNGQGVGHQACAVRRLTPRECERLQSFPDDYTLIPYGRVVKMEKLEQDWIKYLLRGGVMSLDQVCQAAADGPRYKALGNSWCVYNVRWLGRRINAVLSRLSAAGSGIGRLL